jgi:hypothetical protein
MTTQPLMDTVAELKNGLYDLLFSISATLSGDSSTPTLSPHDLLTTAAALATYLMHIATRRSDFLISAATLSFHVLRTRNEEETVIDHKARPRKVLSKGEKEWYYLALSESGEGGKMQILVEGGLRKEKTDVLEGFKELVETGVREWEERKAKRKLGEEKEILEKQKGKDDEKRKNRTQAQWDEKIRALEKSAGWNDWKGKGKDSGKADKKQEQGGKKKVTLEELEEIDDEF